MAGEIVHFEIPADNTRAEPRVLGLAVRVAVSGVPRTRPSTT